MSSQKCACCDIQWKTKDDISYKDLGSKSIPLIGGMELLSKFGTERIQLYFCDIHGSGPALRRAIRYVNGTGILQIKNIRTNRWRNAEKIGDTI